MIRLGIIVAVWALFLVSIISTHKVWSLLGLVSRFVPSSGGFTFTAQDVAYLSWAFIWIPLGLSIGMFFLLDPQWIMRRKVVYSAMVFGAIILSVLCAFGVKRLWEEWDNKVKERQYQQEQNKESTDSTDGVKK